MPKVTVHLDSDQLSQIRELVEEGKAASLSAFVKHAVTLALQDVVDWRKMLDEALEQTGGPLTQQECDWLDAVLLPQEPSRNAKK